MHVVRKLFTGFALALLTFASLHGAQSPPDAPSFETREPVARLPGGRIMTPVNQVLTPFGQQVELPDMRPQALALSPDGQILVTAGRTAEVVVISPTSGNI